MHRIALFTAVDKFFDAIAIISGLAAVALYAAWCAIVAMLVET